MLCIPLLAVIILLPVSDAEIQNVSVLPYGSNEQPDNDRELRNKLSRAVMSMSTKLHKSFHYIYKVEDAQLPFQEINYIINPWEIFNVLLLAMTTMNTGQHHDIQEIYEFIGGEAAHMTREEMLPVLEQYLYHKQHVFDFDPFRRVYIDNAFFIKGNHTMNQEFMRFTKHKYKSAFYNVTNMTDDRILEEMRNVVINHSRHVITEADYINETDFMVALMGNTYVRSYWLYPLSSSWEWFYCINDYRQYKMRMNTDYIEGFYIDEPDRYAVIVPLQIAGVTGILFYVPKTPELFKTLDKNMNFSLVAEMRERLINMDVRRIEVQYPLFNMSFTKKIKDDMMLERVRNIFFPDGVTFPEMTDELHMYVKNIYHQCVITMDEHKVQFASNTYLTFNQDLHKSPDRPPCPPLAFDYGNNSEQTSSEETSKLSRKIFPHEVLKRLTNRKKHNSAVQRKKTFIMRNPKLRLTAGSRRTLPLGRNKKKLTTTAAIEKKFRKYSHGGRFRSKGNTSPVGLIRNIPTNNQTQSSVPVNIQARDRVISHACYRSHIPAGKRNTRITDRSSIRKSFGTKLRFPTILKNERPLHPPCASQGDKRRVNRRKKLRPKFLNKETSAKRQNHGIFMTPPTPTEPPIKVIIDSSFFYGIIYRYDQAFYSLGKVYHCPDAALDDSK